MPACPVCAGRAGAAPHHDLTAFEAFDMTELLAGLFELIAGLFDGW